jgi:hypothetical protein
MPAFQSAVESAWPSVGLGSGVDGRAMCLAVTILSESSMTYLKTVTNEATFFAPYCLVS